MRAVWISVHQSDPLWQIKCWTREREDATTFASPKG
jgi:hypothetical protein